MEAVFDGLIEGLDFSVFVAGRLRIDVGDVAVGCVEFHVDVFGLAEALRKQACGNQQHERERGLQDNESALQHGCAVRGCARVGTQGFSRLGARGHERRRKAKQDSRNQRKPKSKADDQQRRRRCHWHVVLIRKGERQQRVRSQIGDDESEQAAENGEKNALSK